jgi:hypothetical protein
MYIMFILQCQKVQNNCQNVWKEQKQASFIIIFQVSSEVCAYTVTVSDDIRSTWIMYQKNFIRSFTK